MNKQEILDEINKTKEHLTNMEKMLKECEYERWKPKEGEKYYYVNTYNEVKFVAWCNDACSNGIKNVYNYFQTHEQAEQEAEKILVRRQLEDIAKRLNEGREIDWSDEEQEKYFIFLDCRTQRIERDYNLRSKIQGVIYCLDDNFRKIAIQKIGEERLKKYLKGE